MIVGEDASGVAIGEKDLNGVVADLRGGLGASLGLEHGKRSELRGARSGDGGFLFALFVARSTGAMLAEIGEIEVALMAVGPSDVHAGAGGDVDFHAERLTTIVEGKRHLENRAMFRAWVGGRSRSREEWDCRGGRFLGGRGKCKCAGRARD